jgi:transcriptional regulator with XRE-family HTH domain
LQTPLRYIRTQLGVSQSELIEKLQSEDYPIYKGDISNFELGKSEPPLVILLRYARLVNIILDDLVDDEIDLPKSVLRKKSKN